MTIFDLYRMSIKEIENRHDVLSLFKVFFNFDRIQISMHENMVVPENILNAFKLKIDDLKKEMPIQYVVGSVDFMGLNLEVGEGVFIPREDTEVLVRAVYNRLGKNFDGNIIDLCAGSGNISLSLKKLIPNANVTAVEKSEKAFEYLIKNKKRTNLDINCTMGDIFEVCDEFENNKFDAIVSNPPYIRKNEIKNLDKNVQYEPKMSLDGGDDGLYFYKNIISKWNNKLKKCGFFAFEIGYDQYEDVKDLLKNKNHGSLLYKDSHNKNRAIISSRTNYPNISLPTRFL